MILLVKKYRYDNLNIIRYHKYMGWITGFLFIFFNNYKVSPHSFKSLPLHSDMGIAEIVNEVNSLLPQLANFISQFNSTITQSGVNVVTDSIGNLSLDVPQDMSNEAANKVSSRIGIIDTLIRTRSQEINDLLQKGAQLENKLQIEDSNYVSQLDDKVKEFRRLSALYKH